MSKYTIVIVRGEHSGDVDYHPRMVLHVDTDRPSAQLTGLSVISHAPEGLTSKSFPDIDLAAVISALTSHMSTSSDNLGSGPLPADGQATAELMVTSSKLPNDATLFEHETDGSVNLPESSTVRAYRRMPAPEDLRKSFEQIGTVTGLAKYYQVPRHTAQGWIGRLKKLDAQASQKSTHS
ncbi:hypothetical protein [Nocardia sp. NPDC051981]|uniref:hypothetical protein n=1 Tax=Nocardia sp. NPDC051981 TaxID=3155417 RepID=UPI003432381F